MSLPSEKVGGHVPRVPHQIAPMLVITNRKKNQGVTLFAGVSGLPACCMSPTGDVNFVSIPSQNFRSVNPTVLQIQYNFCL